MAKASKAPPKKSPRAEHPILVGMSHKEHGRLARAAAKSEVKVCEFVRLAIATVVEAVL